MRLAWALIALAAWWLLASWGNMLLVMFAHRDWWALLPQMSYRTSMILTGILVLAGVGSGIFQALVKEKK